MSAIRLDGVEKRYGSVTALDGLDLEVERGEVFGFLGPNGAGKSTTIDILLNYSRPSGGEVTVLGEDARRDPRAVRDRVGILPEGFSPFETMTGRQHVAYAIKARGADADPDAILERVGLADAADRSATEYSKGMTQRLALGMALVGEPDLLILDEPSSGLDPHGVRRMREIVRAERERGATVFFSSHVLEQVEAVADRVGILRDGSLIAVDTIDGLRQSAGADANLRVAVDRATDAVVDAAGRPDGVTAVSVEEEALTVTCSRDARLSVLDAVREAGATVEDFESREASLEELFVSYTEGSA